MKDHCPLRIAVIVLAIVGYVVMIVFNGLAAAPNGAGIYKNNTGDISDALYLEITPAGWTFSIWGFIYAWQALWLIYAATTIFRRNSEGTPIYLTPLLPPVIYITYFINNMLNVGWLIAFDRFLLAVALPLIFFTPITLYICLFYTFRRLYHNLGFMIKTGIQKDIWLIRFLVQNGLAFYAAWVSVATLLNLAHVLTYKDGSDLSDTYLNQDVSSTIILGILAVEVPLWFILDIFVFDKYTRYTFSPYITLTVAFSGVVSKNFNLDTAERNSIFSAVLLAVAVTTLVLKVVVMFWRHFKSPIQPRDNLKPTI